MLIIKSKPNVSDKIINLNLTLVTGKKSEPNISDKKEKKL